MTRPNGRLIVIGDIHGELAGLKEILLHTGIVDHNTAWVGGDTILIQTGDVIDRGPHSRGAVSLLRSLQQEAVLTAGSVIRCCGNHELWLLQGNYHNANFSNPDRLAEELREEVARGLLQAAYSDGARLYTHAGLRSIVRHTLLEEVRKARPSVTVKQAGLNALADHINATFRDAVKRDRCRREDHCIFWIDGERGGSDTVGGVFWCDYGSIVPSERAWDVPQVFGHTPAGRPLLRHAHGLKLVNVDAGMFESYGGHRVYLEITAEGTLVQHSKVGERWKRNVLRGSASSQ
jgi:hypothetical protein